MILPNNLAETDVFQKRAAFIPYLIDEGGRFLRQLDASLPFYSYPKHLNCDIALKPLLLRSAWKVFTAL
jgi:hypothetical protein